jgi:hypothetical protein
VIRIQREREGTTMAGRTIVERADTSGAVSRPVSKGGRARFDSTAGLPAHTPGTPRGEELVRRYGREEGREQTVPARTARDSTSVNASARGPIDPRMPHLPPA